MKLVQRSRRMTGAIVAVVAIVLVGLTLVIGVQSASAYTDGGCGGFRKGRAVSPTTKFIPKKQSRTPKSQRDDHYTPSENVMRGKTLLNTEVQTESWEWRA